MIAHHGFAEKAEIKEFERGEGGRTRLVKEPESP
jgi:hypothetical protein